MDWRGGGTPATGRHPRFDNGSGPGDASPFQLTACGPARSPPSPALRLAPPSWSGGHRASRPVPEYRKAEQEKGKVDLVHVLQKRDLPMVDFHHAPRDLRGTAGHGAPGHGPPRTAFPVSVPFPNRHFFPRLL